MNARVDHLFEEARLLGLEERSQLALALLDSIEGDLLDEGSIEHQWIAEAHQRLKLIASGEMKAVSWLDAKARITAL